MLEWHVYTHHTCKMRRMSRIFNSLSTLNHQSPSALYFLSASIVSTEVPLDSELHCPWRLCAFLLLLLLCICTLVGWIHLGEPVKPNNDGSSWLHQIMVGSSLPPFADRMRSLELGHMYESSDLFACTKKGFCCGLLLPGLFSRCEGHYQWSVFWVRCCCDPNSST